MVAHLLTTAASNGGSSENTSLGFNAASNGGSSENTSLGFNAASIDSIISIVADLDARAGRVDDNDSTKFMTMSCGHTFHDLCIEVFLMMEGRAYEGHCPICDRVWLWGEEGDGWLEEAKGMDEAEAANRMDEG